MTSKRGVSGSAFVTALAVFVILNPASALAQWPSLIGIPSPSFGVSETAPSPPNPWTGETPGFYYVEASHSAADDDGNTYGTPARPRRTIPSRLTAGSVVEVRGSYYGSHKSPSTIVAAGTPSSPVFIRGASPAQRPRIQSGWEVQGRYLILENLTFAPGDSGTGSLAMLSPSDHLAIRNSELTGNKDGGGMGIESWNGSTIEHVVVLNNKVHDNGDLTASYDQDVHGVHVGAGAWYVWIVGNELARNSGDGLQINSGGISSQRSTHHIYVGGNVAYQNKQTGFWAKQATDVIFSQNECWGHRPSNSSFGPCMGYQYATQWVWFLFNNIHDSDYGIAVSSDSGLGEGTEAYFIGNVIFNIHQSSGSDNSDSAWSHAAIMLAGGVNRYVIGNTIYDVDGGINSPSPDGSLEIADNIIYGVTTGSHIFVEHASLSSNTSAHHNLFDEGPKIRTAFGTVVATDEQLGAMVSLAGDPKFVNAAGKDFRIQSTSPAAGTGELNGAFNRFAERYGIGITKDAAGRPRTGPTTDIGAYLAGTLFEGETDGPQDVSNEIKGGGAPGVPTGLTALVSGRQVVLNWMSPTAAGTPSNYVIEAGWAPARKDAGRLVTHGAELFFAGDAKISGTFYVRVRAGNASGLGPPSNEVVVQVD